MQDIQLRQEQETENSFDAEISYESILHDMKTPLSIMYSCISALEMNKNVADDMKKPLADLKQNWFRIMKLITDSGDLKKITGGRMFPNFRNYEINTLVGYLVDSTKLLTARKNIALRFEGMAERTIAIDRDMLDRILLNILSNAIKFTRENGEIMVRLEEQDGKLLIKVIDNGAGIPEEDMGKVQEKYFTNHTAANKHGSGLGLYIVKGLVGLLGGELTLTPMPVGTCVTVSLPCFTLAESLEEAKFYDDFYNDNIVQIELSDEY